MKIMSTPDILMSQKINILATGRKAHRQMIENGITELNMSAIPKAKHSSMHRTPVLKKVNLMLVHTVPVA